MQTNNNKMKWMQSANENDILSKVKFQNENEKEIKIIEKIEGVP